MCEKRGFFWEGHPEEGQATEGHHIKHTLLDFPSRIGASHHLHCSFQHFLILCVLCCSYYYVCNTENVNKISTCVSATQSFMAFLL